MMLFSTRRTTALALVAFAILAFAAPEASFARDTVRGSGRIASEQRAVSGFQAVAVNGSMTVVLHQGAREGVEVRGDDNLLPLIETRVVEHGGTPTLEIGVQRGADYSTSREIVVTVDLKSLNRLALAGSGDASGDSLKTSALDVSLAGSGNLRLKGLETDSLKLGVAGSGDVRLAGRATNAAFSIAGSGDIDAAGLEGDDVSVRIAGSGDASVAARRTLNVSIAGSGDVTYRGDATVKQSVMGSGSVRRR